MSFNPTPTSGQITAMQAGGYAADQYLLICPNTVVFEAEITNAPTDATFAQVEFTNVTTGSHTDIKEGYTVAISAATSFRSVPSSNIFRARADNAGTVATSSTLNINQTSASLSNGNKIIVVKDVRETSKAPRIDGSTYYKDFDIQFRRLLPIVNGLQSAYVGVLDNNPQADFAFPATYLVTDADATASLTYSWDADGGSFVSPSTSTSAQPTIRYTTAGHYMPRVTVTDSNGNSNWFTCHVWVVPADYSSVVNLSFDGASINHSISDGVSCSINAPITVSGDALMQIDGIANYTACAVWTPSTKTVLGSDIRFFGRLRSESIRQDVDPASGAILSTAFEVDGLAAIMGRLRSNRMGFIEKDSPSRFDEIEALTPQRAITYFLTEHTTVCNTHSLSFDAFDATYQYLRIGTRDENVLQTVSDIAYQYTAGVEWAATGELQVARIAWYLPSSDRDNLTTVMDMTLADIAVDAGGGRLFDIVNNYIQTLGRVRGYGRYRVGTEQDQGVEVLVPGVTQREGNEEDILNSQILTASSALPAAYTELGGRTANDFAAKQPRVVLQTRHTDGYAWLTPTRSAWFTWTIPDTANNRGYNVGTGSRWTLERKSLRYDPATGRLSVDCEWTLETSGTEFQNQTYTPVQSEPINNPAVPVQPPYDNFPPTPGISSPGGGGGDDEPPFDDGDTDPIDNPGGGGGGGAGDNAGSNLILSSETRVWRVGNAATVPVYEDFTPLQLDPTKEVIRQVLKDPFSRKAWVMTYNADDEETKVYRTNAFGDLQWVATALPGSYFFLRTTDTPDELFIYGRGEISWTHTFQFDTPSGTDPNVTYGNDAGWGFVDLGAYTSGVGITSTLSTNDAAFGFRAVLDNIEPFVMTGYSMTYNLTLGERVNAATPPIRLRAIGDDDTSEFSSASGTNQTFSFPNGTYTGIEEFRIRVTSGIDEGTPPPSPTGDATLLSVTVSGVGPNPFASTNAPGTRRSTDGGASFAAGVAVGNDNVDLVSAMDTQLVGNAVYAVGGDVIRSGNNGTSYSDETDGAPTAGNVTVIHSYGENANDYIFGQDQLSSNAALYDVNNGTRTDITPNNGTTFGVFDVLSASAQAGNNVHMPVGDEDTLFAVGRFSGAGGGMYLCYSSDRGSAWSTVQVGDDAFMVRAKNSNVLFVVEIGVWQYSTDGGATLTSYTPPDTPLTSGAFL